MYACKFVYAHIYELAIKSRCCLLFQPFCCHLNKFISVLTHKSARGRAGEERRRQRSHAHTQRPFICMRVCECVFRNKLCLLFLLVSFSTPAECYETCALLFYSCCSCCASLLSVHFALAACCRSCCCS